MLKIHFSKVASLCVALGAVLVPAQGIVRAGDHLHGTTYYSKVTQHGSLVAYPTYPVVGIGTYVPFSYAYPTFSTTIPTYYYSVTVPTTTTPYLVTQSVGSPTAPTLLSSAGQTPSTLPVASTDYLPDYLSFLQQEAAKYPATLYQAAGVRPNPADVAAFQQNHPQLVAVLGVDRLASIGRFLLTKRADPNFRGNAVKLFEPLLGVYLPQYIPLIDRFLADLNQGASPATTSINDRVPPAPPNPGTPSLTRDPQTGHFFATDADGNKTEFDAEMKPISITKPDGKVTKL